MKKLFLLKPVILTLFIICILQVHGQEENVLYVNDDIVVGSTDSLFINGYIFSDTGSYFDNRGNVCVTDSIVNHSSELFKPSSYGKMDNDSSDSGGDDKFYLKLNTGKIVFQNNEQGSIKNYKSILFDTIIFNTPDTVLLEGDSTVVLGSLVFQNGYFNINSDTILMYYETIFRKPRMSGTITNERDESRIIDPSGKGSIEMVKDLLPDNTDIYNKYHSLGVLPYGTGGLTKFRRFHYFDTLVTDTSVGRVFELVSTQQIVGGQGDFTIHYINSSDVPVSMDMSNLGIWFYGPVNEIPAEQAIEGEDGADYRYDVSTTDFTHLYYPSYVEGLSESDSVTGNAILNEGYRYTAAEVNCDNGPDIFLEEKDTVCAGNQVLLNPFAHTSNELEDYFYMWHCSADSLIKQGTRSAQQISFTPDTALTDSTLKFWVNVRDYRGCHSSDTTLITVMGGNDIKIQFLEPDTTQGSSIRCVGSPFMARDTINTDPEGENHTWWFTDGDTLVDKHNLVDLQLDDPGQYRLNVRYVNQYGCKTSKRDIPVVMHPYPDVNLFVQSPVCQNISTLIENNSSIAPIGGESSQQSAIISYTWIIGEDDSIKVENTGITDHCELEFETDLLKAGEVTAPDLNITFAEEGFTQIILKANSRANCASADTAIAYVNLPAVPDIDPSGLTNVCQGMPSLLVPGDSCANVKEGGYSWKTDPYQPWANKDTLSFIFPDDGEFPVSLAVVSDSGCKDTATAIITIRPNTVANFAFQNHCVGLTSIFRDSLASGAESYFWDFGDETTATDNTPNHSISNKYDTAGNYSVTLISNNQWNCADTISKNIEIYPLPRVSFETEPVICINAQDHILHNTSEGAVEYYWEFSDNTHSNRTEPNKKFSTADIYNISLTGISEHGCQADTVRQIEVYGLVEASYNAALPSVCRSGVSQFEPDKDLGGLSRIHWNFGNGDTLLSFIGNPGVEYTYAEQGAYVATMTTYSVNGCSDTISYQVLIHPNPQLTITTEGQRCSGEEILFRPNDGFNINEISEFLWKYDDGSMPGINPTVSHFFAEPRTYEVTVEIISQQGCLGYDTLNLEIDTLPEFPFAEETSTCETSLELLAGPASFQYLWSDGSTGNSLLVTSNGNYGVTIINPASGCTTTGNTDVFLSAEVQPALGADRSACDQTLLDAHNPGAEYLWSTGATSRTILTNTSGTYWVEVNDINGCIGRDTIEVTVNSSPELTLPDVLNACGGNAITIDPGVSAGTFSWNTGETTSTITTNQAGTYFVHVTDANGCTDNALTTLTFYPLPIVYLGEDITICEGNPVLLNAGNTGATYLWSDGSSAGTLSPENSGTYWVEVTNRYTCAGSDTIQVTFNPVPEIDLGGDQSICSGHSLILDAAVPGRYYWSTGETSQTIEVSQQNHYWVRVTDNNQCSSLSDPIEVTFKEAPFDPFPNDSISACAFTLLDADNPGSTYLWNDNNTGRNYLVEETGQLWVQITNAEACSITDSIYVRIKPVAELELPDEIEICSNSHGFIDAGYFGEEYSYRWNIGSTEQYIRVESEGKYKVDVTHVDGCVSTDSTVVIAAPAPEINLGTEVLMCANSGLELNAGTPGSLYTWGSSSGLDFSGQILPLTDTGTYWVRVMAPNGCTASDTVKVLHTSMSLRPLFLAASNIAIGDTVRFVDLSVPEPINYFWDFGDMTVSYDKEPMHIYYAEDTFNVVLTVSNGVCNASITKPLTVEGYNPDYLIKLAREREKMLHPGLVLIVDARVYPNPASEYIKLDLAITNKSDVMVHLFDLSGKIYDIQRFDDIEQIEYSFNVSNFYQGMYFLRIATINEVKTFKVLIAR